MHITEAYNLTWYFNTFSCQEIEALSQLLEDTEEIENINFHLSLTHIKVGL